MPSLRASLLLASLVTLALPACDDSGGNTGGGGTGTAPGGSAGATPTGGSGGATSTATLAPGECRKDADCTGNGEYCAAPGSPSCGGAGCGLPSCAMDQDCQGMGLYVCDIDPCCGDLRCIPGCHQDAPCAEGQECTLQNHCVPQPCADKACPANFDCGMPPEQSCARRACTADAECDGYCVLGSCYGALGFCDLPKP